MHQDKLGKLLKLAQKIEMTPSEREKQRRSFAYGNTKVENSDMTTAAIDLAAVSVSHDR
jgi:hypothetical protein